MQRLYEGMFLFESREKGEWEPYRDHALGILERHGAKVLRQEKWAERKLAYEIKRVRRGIYFLTHFEADPTVIDTIRRDCSISEKILRVLILRRDALPQDASAETAQAAAEAAPAKAGEGGAAPGAEAPPAGDAKAPAEEAPGAEAPPVDEAPAEGAAPEEAPLPGGAPGEAPAEASGEPGGGR